MAQQDLINAIGKVLTDKTFKEKFRKDPATALSEISGLDENEKKGLIENAEKICQCADNLDIEYDGYTNKTRH